MKQVVAGLFLSFIGGIAVVVVVGIASQSPPTHYHAGGGFNANINAHPVTVQHASTSSTKKQGAVAPAAPVSAQDVAAFAAMQGLTPQDAATQLNTTSTAIPFGQNPAVCQCPPPHAAWVNNTSVSAKGNTVIRTWKWIPAHTTHGGRFYPGHWTCSRSGVHRWHPAHTTKSTYIPGHFGWVYSVVK